VDAAMDEHLTDLERLGAPRTLLTLFAEEDHLNFLVIEKLDGDGRLFTDFQNISGQPPFLLKWIGNGIPIGNQFTNIGEGEYKLVLTDARSCSDTATVNIKSPFQFNYNALKDEYATKYNTSIPFNVLQNDANVGNHAVNVVIATPPNGRMIYSQTNGKGTYTPNLKFFGKEIVQYIVCSAECPESCDTSTVEFNVESPCNDKTNLKLPNIIFPNASGINRYFHVEAIEKCPAAFGPKPSSLKVFNRWGDLVYSSHEYKNDWDGENNKGQPLPDGTYYYLLDMGSQGGPVKGWVVIMR
jgi:gliding motility-associated-like protein